MHENDVLVVEGIHALNPELTAQIPDEQIFRVYASAFTTILLDSHNYVPTTDNRPIVFHTDINGTTGGICKRQHFFF